MRSIVSLVSVLFLLSASARATTASPGASDHLKCFRVQDLRGQTNIHYTLDLTPAPGGLFTLESGCRVQSAARNLCIPVSKTIVSSSGGARAVVAPGAQTYVCYNMRCPRETNVTVDLSDQLGGSGTLLVQQHSGKRQLCVPSVGAPSTTSTTTSPGGAFCGDNKVNQASEQCDGTDPGICPINLPIPVACDTPDSPHPCQCCLPDECVIAPDFDSRCCGDARCIDQTGVGMVRPGACIPFTCTQASDCHTGGYDCVGGGCCALPGSFCAGIDCCPGTGSTCVQFLGSAACCKTPGMACSGFAQECCSGSCNANGTCD